MKPKKMFVYNLEYFIDGKEHHRNNAHSLEESQKLSKNFLRMFKPQAGALRGYPVVIIINLDTGSRRRMKIDSSGEITSEMYKSDYDSD